MDVNDRALFNYAVASFSDGKIKEQYNRFRDSSDEEITERDVTPFKQIYASLILRRQNTRQFTAGMNGSRTLPFDKLTPSLKLWCTGRIKTPSCPT